MTVTLTPPLDQCTTEPMSKGRLYDEYLEAVERWVRRIGGPRDDEEDMVHEVFVQAFHQLPRFRGEAKLGTWLFVITERVVYRRLKKERRRRFVSRLLLHEPPIAEHLPAPSAELERKEDTAILYAALERIPQKYRTVLTLYELDGLRGEEIAALTEITVAAVWARLHRGRALLEKALNGLAFKTQFRAQSSAPKGTKS